MAVAQWQAPSDMAEKFSIHKVLEHYAGTVVPQRGSGWSQIHCPVHDESNPSASFNEELGKVHCFGCTFHGDALDLIKIKEGLQDYSAQVAFAEEITGETLTSAGSAAVKLPSRRLPARISDGGSVSGVATPGSGSPISGQRRRVRRIID